MYKLKTKLLHIDVLIRLNSIKKPQAYLEKKLVISRATFYRLSIGKSITMETFLKLINWLDKEPGQYIKFYKNDKK
jgi:DNA-binding Xre family transcriptional regulator